MGFSAALRLARARNTSTAHSSAAFSAAIPSRQKSPQGMFVVKRPLVRIHPSPRLIEHTPLRTFRAAQRQQQTIATKLNETATPNIIRRPHAAGSDQRVG